MKTPLTNHQNSNQDSQQPHDGNKHLVVYGLAGTGKSHYITQLIEGKIKNREIKKNEFLVFTFDRKLRQNYCEKTETFNQTNTYNVHSFCFSVLKSLDLLPKQFFEVSSLDCCNKLTSNDYNQLIQEFLEIENKTLLSSHFIKKYVKPVKLIVCDEVQDFREDYFQVIKKIKRIGSNTKIILSGDSHQRIYSFQDKHNRNKLSNVILDPSLFFEKEDYKIKVLRKNYRLQNKENQRFVNAFLVNVFNTDEEYLYDIEQADTSKWKKKPIIHYFSSIKDEIKYIQKEIGKVSDELSIGILGRTKKDIAPYNEIYSEDKRVTVSTVHSLKGGEKDYIFYVGFNYDEKDLEFSTICFTAISRAKKRLIITSSHPIGKMKEVFSEGTYEFFSTQKPYTKAYIIKNQIKHNRNFSWKKIRENNLDSLVLKVKEDNCPFIPYIQKRGTNQYIYQSVIKTQSKDDLEYSIKKHHSSKTFYFEFKDLNLLKRNNFSDTKIIKACVNEVLRCFDNRVLLEDIVVQELHLCKFLKFEDKLAISTFFKKHLEKSILGSRNSSIMNDQKERITSKLDMLHFFSVFDDTLYVNHNSKKYESLTTVLYYPLNKENENKIHMDNLYKIEMRSRGNYLNRKKAMRDGRNVLNLLSMCEENKLKDLFYRWVEYYFDEDLVEVIKKLGV